jgi:hypothetical protein
MTTEPEATDTEPEPTDDTPEPVEVHVGDEIKAYVGTEEVGSRPLDTTASDPDPKADETADETAEPPPTGGE